MKSYTNEFVKLPNSRVAQYKYAEGKRIFYKIGEENGENVYETVAKNTEFFDFKDREYYIHNFRFIPE